MIFFYLSLTKFGQFPTEVNNTKSITVAFKECSRELWVPPGFHCLTMCNYKKVLSIQYFRLKWGYMWGQPCQHKLSVLAKRRSKTICCMKRSLADKKRWDRFPEGTYIVWHLLHYEVPPLSSWYQSLWDTFQVMIRPWLEAHPWICQSCQASIWHLI